MKLLLLHGPATKTSRNKLQEFKNKFSPDNVMVFDKGEDIEKVLINLNSVSLFEGERLVILENPEENFQFQISNFQFEGTLVLWFDHQLKETSKILKSVKEQKGEVLNFPEGKEVSVFPFLDLLVTKDQKAYLEMDKLKQAGYDIFYFLTMVFYLLRNLVVTPKNAPDFVRQKLQRQRQNFSQEEIKNLYKNLLEIDFKIKSGLLEKDQAEFLLVNMFVE